LHGQVKARRQIGARHVAWMRGAFLGGRARPNQRVGHPANREPDGATRGAGARTGGLPCMAAGRGKSNMLDFRAGFDISGT
jgi:hypothetical protein